MADHSSHAGATRHRAPRRTAGMWLDLLASIVATIVVGLLFVAVLGAAISGADRRGSTRVGELILAVCVLAALAGCVRWAIRAEHRFRDGEPRPRGGLEKSWHRSAHPGHYGPVSIAVGLLLFGGGTVALVATAISDHSQGSRSAYVQSHGTAGTGTVTDVVDTQHCGKSSCHYTSTIAVRLAGTIDGTTQTTAHYNGSAPAVDGEQIHVLVDPREPSYAELPGSPFKGAHTWITSAIMAVVCALFTALLIRGVSEQRRHRRTRVQAARQPA